MVETGASDDDGIGEASGADSVRSSSEITKGEGDARALLAPGRVRGVGDVAATAPELAFVGGRCLTER